MAEGADQRRWREVRPLARIAAGWSETAKTKIRDTRVHSRRVLVAAVRELRRPEAMTSQSATGFHGPSDDRVLDEGKESAISPRLSRGLPPSEFLPPFSKHPSVGDRCGSAFAHALLARALVLLVVLDAATANFGQRHLSGSAGQPLGELRLALFAALAALGLGQPE